MDLNKLSTPEKIISASAIVLFIASLLPWFKVGPYSGNGWDVGFLWGGIPTLIGLVMLAHVLVSNFAENVNIPEAPWPMIHLVGGILAGALILLKLLIGEEAGIAGFTIDIDRAYGLFIASLAGIGLAAGGFLYNQEYGGTGS